MSGFAPPARAARASKRHVSRTSSSVRRVPVDRRRVIPAQPEHGSSLSLRTRRAGLIAQQRLCVPLARGRASMISRIKDGLSMILAIELQTSRVHVSPHSQGIFMPSNRKIRGRKIALEVVNYASSLASYGASRSPALMSKHSSAARVRIAFATHASKMRWICGRSARPGRHARRSPRGRDDARGRGTDRAARVWRRASACRKD